MTLLEALILGIVQGATEFLPISSSGHLVLVEELLKVHVGLILEVTLHAGTLLAVAIYFRRRLAWMATSALREDQEGRRARVWILWLALATLPAVAVGLGFKSGIEAVFESRRWALWGLIATGVVIFSTFRLRSRGRSAIGPAGLVMGIAQAVAILPGVSRSGTTIAAGMWCGVDRSEAAEFSFLLSLPAIAGAMLLQAFEVGAAGGVPSGLLAGLVVGLLGAFLSGYAAIAGLLEVLRRRGLHPFAWYCWAVGLAGLILI